MPQQSGGGAPAVAARTLHVSIGSRLMSAARIASDDFAIDMCIWIRQGIGLAPGRKAARGDAVCAWAKSVGTLRANEDEGPEVLYRPLI